MNKNISIYTAIAVILTIFVLPILSLVITTNFGYIDTSFGFLLTLFIYITLVFTVFKIASYVNKYFKIKTIEKIKGRKSLKNYEAVLTFYFISNWLFSILFVLFLFASNKIAEGFLVVRMILIIFCLIISNLLTSLYFKKTYLLSQENILNIKRYSPVLGLALSVLAGSFFGGVNLTILLYSLVYTIAQYFIIKRFLKI